MDEFFCLPGVAVGLISDVVVRQVETRHQGKFENLFVSVH